MLIWKGFLVSTPRGILYRIYSARIPYWADYTANFPLYIPMEILRGKASSIPEPNTAYSISGRISIRKGDPITKHP
jgi:hypothetical protein